MAEGSPTVRRRELGALLRKLREERGMSVKQVTEHLLCSPSKVSRIETGQRGATLRDVRDLCDLYGVAEEAERDRLMSLAREGKQQGWWQSYDLPYSSYVGFEAEAASIKDYDSAVVPGLLQSPEYVRALHDNPLPEPADVTPELVERRVTERKRRQQLLVRADPSPLDFWAILDEAVLHRAIGGPAVMRSQLERVIEATQMPNVTVQVIPYTAGAHPALDSTFNILEFSGAVPDLVYSEGLAGFIYMDRADDVDRYKRVFAQLCEIALSPEHTSDLIYKVSQSYASALEVIGQHVTAYAWQYISSDYSS